MVRSAQVDHARPEVTVAELLRLPNGMTLFITEPPHSDDDLDSERWRRHFPPPAPDSAAEASTGLTSTDD